MPPRETPLRSLEGCAPTPAHEMRTARVLVSWGLGTIIILYVFCFARRSVSPSVPLSLRSVK